MRSYITLSLFFSGVLAVKSPQVYWSGASTNNSSSGGSKVPVVLGVMSKCPDAVLCEAVFDRVLKEVGDKVELSLTYVAHVNASEPEYGVTCKHGPSECAGNIQQLCATQHASTKNWWRFVQCQNFQGKETVGDAKLAIGCAKAADIDESKDGRWATCTGVFGEMKSNEGVQLLKESARRTEKLKIEKSCTMLINGKHVCVRDSEWKECPGGHEPEDFIRQINDEYERLNKSS